MRFEIILLGITVASCLGCHSEPPSSESSIRTVSAQNGGYKIIWESPPGTNQGSEANRSPNDSGKVVDHITITCGAHTVRIEDTDLTLNGVAVGTVKRGDTIKLTSEGKVFVNDEPRQP